MSFHGPSPAPRKRPQNTRKAKTVHKTKLADCLDLFQERNKPKYKTKKHYCIF